MKVNEELVNKVAHLARLEFTQEEKIEVIDDMNKILTFMEKLNEIDTSNVKPLIYMTDSVNVFRPDVVKTEITKDEALLNAPKKNSDYFRVAKVIE